MPRPFTRNRLGNKRVSTDGYSFASKLEAATYQLIKLREKAGEIKLVQVQATVYLTRARIKYIPDFKCIDLITGEDLYIESKGYPNDRWPVIKKLWAFYGPTKLEIWTGSYMNPKLTEIIVPEAA